MAKQGITFHMSVSFDGVDLDDVSQIEFVFTQTRTGAVKKSWTWISSAEGPGGLSARSGNKILVPWSREDTYLFQENAAFFMDTRITLTESSDNPETPIVPLRMNPTLFEEGTE